MVETQAKQKEKAEITIANWYNALKQIYERKGEVGTMAEFIRARNSAPFEDRVWQYGANTKAGLDYAKNNPVLLLRENSELLNLENAERAVQLYRKDKEYSITQGIYNSHLSKAEKESKKAPEKRSILILPGRDNFSITSQSHFDVLRFLAESPKEAEKYLERLSEKGIKEIKVILRNKNYVDNQDSPFTDQLWLHRLDDRSYLSGSNRYLDGSNDGVIGVRQVSGEASTQKISRKESELYTPGQISSALKGLGILGLEESILGNLRKNR